MPDLNFSLMSNVYTPEDLDQVLLHLGDEVNAHYKWQAMNWGSAWTDLVRVALYGHGPDVSEVGTTWVSDMVGMNSLRPFTAREIQTLGGAKTFIPALWQTCREEQSGEVWALPWLLDMRLVYYRKDVLRKAGVSETGAFATVEAMQNTLTRIQAYGHPMPLAMSTAQQRATLQILASFVWGADGDFISSDGKKALLNLPETRAGFRQYFELRRFLSQQVQAASDVQCDTLYRTDQAAVTISGPWLLRAHDVGMHVVANTGYAIPPGAPFVGGTNLVVWGHTHHPKEALALVQRLTSYEEQMRCAQSIGMLPSRLDVIRSSELNTVPLFRTILDSVDRGRSFRLFHLWGLVEDRITSAIGSIWNEIFADPDCDLDALLDHRLTALTRQLNLVLSGR